MKNLILKLILISSLLCTVVFTSMANGADEDEIVIAGIVFQNDLFMKTTQKGMQAVGDEMGITVLLANSENKVDKEANLIDTYISRKVDAIVLTPVGSNGGSDPALQRAIDAGIKIVYFGTNAGAPAVTFVGTSDDDIGIRVGEAAAKFIDQKMSGQDINVASVTYKSQVPWQAEARTGGILGQIDNKQGYTLVSEQEAWLAEMSVRVTGDILTANPNTNMIVAANEGGLVGAVQAVRNANLQGKVYVFGVDGSDQVAQMLLSDDNVLQFAAAQDAFSIGREAMLAAIKALNGETVEKRIVVPPILLSRDDPAGVKKYQEQLKSYQ